MSIPNVDPASETTQELISLRGRIAELEQLEKQYQRRQALLEQQLKAAGFQPPVQLVECQLPCQQLQQEMSDKRQVETALGESEERLRLALDAANMGFWDWQILTEKVIWSENHARLFGLVPGSFAGTYEAFLSCVHPEDRQKVTQKISQTQASEPHYSDQFRIVWPDKTIHWIASKGKFFFDQQGQPIRMIGTCMDISESKQTEEKTQHLTNQVQEQANILDAILATSVDHIFIFNSTGQYQYVSDGGAAGMGLHPEDIVGKTVRELDLPKDLIEKCEYQYQTVMENGTPIKDECEYVTVNGTQYYEYILTPLRNINQKIEGVITVSRNITEHKRAEQSLRDSEARFRRLFESNLIGVAFWTVDGFITDANDAYLKLAGYTREEFAALGKIDWRELTPSEYRALDDRAIAEVKANGVSQLYEKEYIHRNGKRVAVVLGVALLNDSQNMGVAFVLDINERKQIEQERDRLLSQERLARQEAEVANRIKDEFLAVLSHELRTPLNPILGWSKLLRSRKFDQATTERALETIERNAKLQTQLIEDLLDVSRILQGKLTLNVCPVSVVMVVEAAVETVRLAADAKSIQIQTVLDPNLSQVMGDPNRLQQVVWNLLSNAVKFTPSGGRVDIYLTEVNHRVQIQVSDTGKGIAPDFLPYVFDYFRQADSTTTRKFGGLGLGLAIVRQVVELHGGTVAALSLGEGMGTTFKVNLPLIHKHEPMSYEDDQPLPLNHPSPMLSGTRVLVVDDEPDIRDLVSFILEDYGVEVTAVTSAQEALDILSESLPDILISDIGMPEVDGYMLIRQLRQQPPQQGGNIPAIALTAYAGEINQQQAMEAGFQMHVSKPVDPDALIEAIASLISH
ncbi:PAS domain-containing hybrid sensor histidine kinase/response regulator [Nostoc sp. UHCC 0870]|uniref:PAS domain-containing hybrid sensor histidine kinase/response regulator n=1 Tax=Nostoc sp. UHCC 0870 TaxID=2914041 RepID=UPI001EDDA62B|nr:PAS domain S-box protein [Nostoc sp. UHCC 0870]UKO98583.1 PAS domain S-box protein [Nostoc sp. UHCC 0870]